MADLAELPEGVGRLNKNDGTLSFEFFPTRNQHKGNEEIALAIIFVPALFQMEIFFKPILSGSVLGK